MSYNAQEIKEKLQTADIFELVQNWGGEPEWSSTGFIAATICHNPPGVGSRKLYYYEENKMFHCFTDCSDNFDIYDLCRKVMKIQFNQNYGFYDAVKYVAMYFGFVGTAQIEPVEKLADWEIFENINRLSEVETGSKPIELKEYNAAILKNFNHNVSIGPWLADGISADVMRKAGICYYPGRQQIVIPHYDVSSRLIGIRGRALVEEDAEQFGKYRPLKLGSKELYNHPLGLNLYGINWAKNKIAETGKAIIFESEKSVLQFASYFGWDNNMSVACCGSNVTNFQLNLLLSLGAKEIIIGFDRQFQKIQDAEYQHLIKNLLKIHQKYSTKAEISFIFDKDMITPYKASPTDCGKETFLQLFKNRIYIS